MLKYACLWKFPSPAILVQMCEGKNEDVAYLEFSKAIGSVFHEILLLN